MKGFFNRYMRINGPEFESIYTLGGLNEIDSLEEIAWLNDLCDRLGMNTMSAGNMAAFAVEAFKVGKTGYEIDYNQPDKTSETLSITAGRRGIGDIFANSIKRAVADEPYRRRGFSFQRRAGGDDSGVQ